MLCVYNSGPFFQGELFFWLMQPCFLFTTGSNLVFCGALCCFYKCIFCMQEPSEHPKKYSCLFKNLPKGEIERSLLAWFLNRIFFIKTEFVLNCGILLQIFMERFSQIFP